MRTYGICVEVHVSAICLLFRSRGAMPPDLCAAPRHSVLYIIILCYFYVYRKLTTLHSPAWHGEHVTVNHNSTSNSNSSLSVILYVFYFVTTRLCSRYLYFTSFRFEFPNILFISECLRHITSNLYST